MMKKTTIDRRGFLKISSAGAAGMMALGPLGLSSCANTNRKEFGVGLQLYTIRDAMGADVPGSLEKVSLLGYRYVEAKFDRSSRKIKHADDAIFLGCRLVF